MYSSNPRTPDRTPEPPSESEPPPPPARETRTATRRTDRPAPSLSMDDDDDEDDPEIMSILQQPLAPVITNVYAPPLVSYTQAELEQMLGLGMDITTGTARRVRRRRGQPPAS